MSVATHGGGGAGSGGAGGAVPGAGAGAGAGECIHSGHFMVSQFEAEAQEDEEPPPRPPTNQPILAIDTSLNNLFQCMSLAYRQKLTSPKWNRFKGVKLRWKDKIRLNNVIWRCWHMQFIMKQNTLVCQFASPLDVDTHTKPETTLLEGKYWKRRAEAVIAEYKKWRMYYRNMALGWSVKDVNDVIADVDIFDWQSQGDSTHMLVDEDYISFMSDTLFSTITNNQPFAFPDTREIARGASLADFIQPSLGPLQPNLEDFMDTLEPLQDLFTVKLPPVPEESVPTDDSVYRNTFSQTIMDSGLQHSLNNTSYPITSMPMQHLNLSQQTQHHSNTHTNILQSPNNQLVSHDPIIPGLQSIPHSLENQQSAHNAIIISRQNQNHEYVQSNSNSQIDLSSTVITPSHSQSMMVQSYNIINPSLQSVSNQMMTHQSIIPNNQDMSKSSHQYGSPQKLYHQIPVAGFHERNYNHMQGPHQSRSDTSFTSGMSRRVSGSGGCIRERVSRQRPSPLTPPNSTLFNQYNSQSSLHNSSQNLAEKSYSDHIHEQNLITSSNNNIPQNVSLTAGIFLSNIGGQTDQNLSGSSSSVGSQAIPRFKMPSPPPQISNSAIIALPQISTNKNNSQQHVVKVENFRSNSLPIGATLGTVLGTTRISRPRRPRSGSCSPAPPRRVPLNTAASEPSLNPASVLLAHLLNSNSQEMFSSGSMQSLTSESSSLVSQQMQPVAIVPAPTTALLTPKIPPSSPQLIGLDSISPTSATSPQSPPSPMEGGKEHRRAGHIHAEQKRRYNIKNGFDLLQSLIPQLAQNPSAKVSKAAMLQKGAEYIKQLQAEQYQIKEEIEGFRKKIEFLDNSISNCQSLLPATGAPVSRQRSGKLKEMFDDYVCQRTNENWKFWIFSLLIEPLLGSFNNCVSQASTEELKRSTLLWAEQHCSLVELRPAVLTSLRNLCTTTDILSNPGKLPDEAQAAVNKKKPKER